MSCKSGSMTETSRPGVGSLSLCNSSFGMRKPANELLVKTPRRRQLLGRNLFLLAKTADTFNGHQSIANQYKCQIL